jgi:hypothetical protein
MPLNLEGVEPIANEGFQPIPDGVYAFRITKASEQDAVGEKNGQHKFQLTVQHGPYERRIVFCDFALTEKMAGYIRHFYNIIGATSFKELNPLDYIGKPLRAEVHTDEYNGKKNNKVRLGCYYPWDGKEETAEGGSSVASKTSAAKTEVKATKSSPFSNAAPKAAAAKSAGKQSTLLPPADDGGEPPF